MNPISSSIQINIPNVSSQASEVINVLQDLLKDNYIKTVHIKSKKTETPITKKITIQNQKEKNLKRMLFTELPLSFQKELKNEISDELCVVSFMVLKISQISFEILKSNQDLVKNLHLIPLTFSPIYTHYYTKNDTEEKKQQEYIYLKTCIEILKNEIQTQLPNELERNQILYERIYNILNDFDEYLIQNKEPKFIDVLISDIIRNDDENAIDSTMSINSLINSLQKKINLTFRFYTCVYEIFLKNNKIFQNRYKQIKEDWENIDKIYIKIKKYLAEKRKKPFNYKTCDLIMTNLWKRFKSFKDVTLICNGFSDIQLLSEIPSEPCIDYNKYPLKSYYYVENFTSDLFYNMNFFHGIQKFIRLATLDIRQETLKLFASYCLDKNLMISEKKFNKLLKHLDILTKKINKVNISFDQEVYTTRGKESGNFVFIQLDICIKNIKKNYSLYLEAFDTKDIANIYMNLFWFRHDINNNLNKFMLELVDKITSQKEIIEKTPKKQNKEFRREIRIFSHCLNNIYDLKEILNENFLPIQEMINNFEEELLIEKNIFQKNSEEDIPNIMEIKNEIPQEINTSIESIYRERTKSSTKKSEDIEEKTPEETFNCNLNSLTQELKNKINEHESIHNIKFMDLIDEVVQNGFEFLKQTGSHLNFKNPEHPSLGIVTVPRHKIISPGVVKQVRNIIHQK